MGSGQDDVTQLLSDIARGDQKAADKLIPLVYEELNDWREATCGVSELAIRCKPQP